MMKTDKSAIIVIPTTGSPLLKDALSSVFRQTYANLHCLVVIDGPEFESKCLDILGNFPMASIMVLPWNTGAGGWYGHRIYFMSAPLINQDYWFALDQDNWFEPDHVSSMVNACEKNGWDWCHSLRKIHSPDSSYLCDDDCESLGRYPIFFNEREHLVDTSSYCIRRETLVGISPAWYSGWGGDRRVYSALSSYYPRFGCTGKYTLSYRLSGNEKSVNLDFFKQGNSIMKDRYPQGFPWRTT